MRLFSSSLFRRKNVEQLIHEMNSGERLNRRLGPLALAGLGIGATIGTGLYVLIGVVAREATGPSLVLSFLLAAVGCGFAALCYSELASMVPVAGSAYTYAYTTLGELAAWIIGWDLILEYAIGSSVVAAGWSNHLDALLRNVLHIRLDPRLTAAPWDYRLETCKVLLEQGDALRRRSRGGLAQLTRDLHHGGHHCDPGHRHQGKRGLQRDHGVLEYRSDPGRRGHRLGLHRPQELASVLARRQRMDAELPKVRAGFSLPTSDLTRSRHTRKRRGGRSATWRWESWEHSRSARSCTWRLPSC